jgi:hypothetical protein
VRFGEHSILFQSGGPRRIPSAVSPSPGEHKNRWQLGLVGVRSPGVLALNPIGIQKEVMRWK